VHRRLLLTVAACLVLFACFEVPIGKPEEGRIDPRLDGLWIGHDESGGAYETWLIVPFDEHVYCLVYAQFDAEGKRNPDRGGAMRGWITPLAGDSFISLEPVQQILPDFDRPKDYELARLSFEADGTLGVELVNYQFGGLQHAPTTAALMREIEENIHDPKLFEKRQLFRRIDASVAVEKSIRGKVMVR
jgi:hypothetical protein